MSAPALPPLWLMQVWLPLGWAVVLAALVLVVVHRCTRHRGVVLGMPLLVALWTLLPGDWSPACWLLFRRLTLPPVIQRRWPAL